MKSLFLSVGLFIVLTAQAQRKTFVRAFADNGKITHKGYLINTTDSNLTLINGNEKHDILISKISKIKLKRSVGYTMLVSSLSGGVPFALLAAAANDPNAAFFAISTGEAAIAGFIFGTALGAVTGALIAGTQNRPVFTINMKRELWMKVKPILDTYLSEIQNSD